LTLEGANALERTVRTHALLATRRRRNEMGACGIFRVPGHDQQWNGQWRWRAEGRWVTATGRSDVGGRRELAQFSATLLAAGRRRRGTPKGSRALTCF
jgi:hypothetical protein